MPKPRSKFHLRLRETRTVLDQRRNEDLFQVEREGSEGSDGRGRDGSESLSFEVFEDGLFGAIERQGEHEEKEENKKEEEKNGRDQREAKSICSSQNERRDEKRKGLTSNTIASALLIIPAKLGA